MDISKLLTAFESQAYDSLPCRLWKAQWNSFHDDCQKVSLWPTRQASNAATRWERMGSFLVTLRTTISHKDWHHSANLLIRTLNIAMPSGACRIYFGVAR
jgi:hypothetical protein